MRSSIELENWDCDGVTLVPDVRSWITTLLSFVWRLVLYPAHCVFDGSSLTALFHKSTPGGPLCPGERTLAACRSSLSGFIFPATMCTPVKKGCVSSACYSASGMAHGNTKLNKGVLMKARFLSLPLHSCV